LERNTTAGIPTYNFVILAIPVLEKIC